MTLVLVSLNFSNAAYIEDRLLPAKTTFINDQQTLKAGSETPGPILLKRDALAEPKKAVVNKEWIKDESEKVNGPTSELPQPWIRTIYGTVVEVVTPYVVGDVTFANKQPETTDGLEPWISINNNGLPKTIHPRMKNGKVDKGFPDVGTYFQTATTVVYNQKDLNAHNLNDDAVVKQVEMIDEDDTYIKLSPLQRCTPDYYYKKGIANIEMSEPFCAPRDHQKMRVGKTYFITWYTRFFENVEKVKFHYAFVNEKSHDKGFDKRDLIDESLKDVDAEIEQMSGNVKFQGDVYGSFFSSEWIKNDGWYALDIDEKWLQGKVYKKVVISIQPDSVPDDEFSILDGSHFFATFQLRENIGKNTKEMRKLQDQTGTNDDFYYVVTAIPTAVMVSVLFMYFFLYLNRKHRDLSHIRKPKKSRFGNQGKYNIPVSLTDTRKPGKQS